MNDQVTTLELRLADSEQTVFALTAQKIALTKLLSRWYMRHNDHATLAQLINDSENLLDSLTPTKPTH